MPRIDSCRIRENSFRPCARHPNSYESGYGEKYHSPAREECTSHSTPNPTISGYLRATNSRPSLTDRTEISESSAVPETPFVGVETPVVNVSSLVAEHTHDLHRNAHGGQNRVNHSAQHQADTPPDRWTNFCWKEPHVDSKNLKCPDGQNRRRH